jgi:dTDP-4-amino-4,6-dideoxy-D-glucose acyltransferase
MTSFLSRAQLQKRSFKSLGENVLISRYSRIYNPSQIQIGNNVRIDDFCLLSGGPTGAKGIQIGDHVHIASHCGLWGQQGIILSDFCGISSGSKIYSESDDFSGLSLTGPTIPEQYKKIDKMKRAQVSIGKHAILGANSVVLPGVTIGEGSTIGSGSVVTRPCEPWGIYAGSPLKLIKQRSRDLLKDEIKLLNRYSC